MAAIPIKKGVEYDCLMFEVRCKQPCVENGLRITSKCPYDNYNSKPDITSKGVNSMAGKSNTGKPVPVSNGNDISGGGNFQPTFRKYADMSNGEKAAFRQGAKTSENKVKERLGFAKPKG